MGLEIASRGMQKILPTRQGWGTRGTMSPEPSVLRVLGLFEDLERMDLRLLSIPRCRDSEMCAPELWNGFQTGHISC